MKFEKLGMPEFLLCEIPIKDKSIHDDRLWIYASGYLSLIEAYCDGYVNFEFPPGLAQKKYYYKNSDGLTETWVLVFIQNNVGYINPEQNQYEVLDQAFHFLETYMTWEDINIDFN